jgi:uncharacterized protein YbjT (DUF2867 family)
MKEKDLQGVKPMILVAGATGFLGSEICRRLLEKGKPVRALVRTSADVAKVEALRNQGAAIVYGDLRDRASLDEACRNITSVISTATAILSTEPENTLPATDQQGQINLVDAASAAGVSQFVYISYSANLDTDCALTTAKRAVEERLRQSGMTYTILRPSYFMEAWLSPAVGFDYPNAKATIYGEGNNKISWISLGDVAAFAVEALDNPAAHNATLELGGPEALSPLEVVQIFEEVSGKPFERQHVPEAALQAQYAGATEPVPQSFTALSIDYAHGDLIDMERTSKAFPIELTSVQQYAQRVARVG